MRKSKQNRKKNRKGTNLKVSPLKTYKKQVKRMKNRIRDIHKSDSDPALVEKKKIYEARLALAEAALKNWDKQQEEKKAAALLKKKV